MIISEQQRKEILSLHGQYGKDIAIFNALSLNENYVILLDELFDVKNQTRIGNVWDSIDNFKLFINDSPNNLGESLLEIKKSVNSIVITESLQTLRDLKKYFILFREQESEKGFFSKVGDWATDKAKDAWSGIKQTAQTAAKGVQDFASSISKGEIAQAFSIVGKGVVFLAKKLRDALYHPVGMILDAILVASGIGKSAQFIIWAIVVALDVYELSTGDYGEGGFWGKLLFTGVDLIGLIFAGVAAKGAKGVVGDFIRRFGKSTETMKQGIAQSPKMKAIVEQINGAIKSAPGKLQNASTYLTQKSPKIGGWVAGILGKVGGFLKKITDFLSYLVVGTVKAGQKIVSVPGKIVTKAAEKIGVGSQKAARAGAMTTAGLTSTGLAYGFDVPNQAVAAPAITGDIFAANPRDFSKGL